MADAGLVALYVVVGIVATVLIVGVLLAFCCGERTLYDLCRALTCGCCDRGDDERQALRREYAERPTERTIVVAQPYTYPHAGWGEPGRRADVPPLHRVAPMPATPQPQPAPAPAPPTQLGPVDPDDFDADRDERYDDGYFKAIDDLRRSTLKKDYDDGYAQGGEEAYAELGLDPPPGAPPPPEPAHRERKPEHSWPRVLQ